MPSFNKSAANREKPWLARVQLEGKVYYLDYHRTKNAVLIQEDTFKNDLYRTTAEAQFLWRQRMRQLNQNQQSLSQRVL